MYNFTCKQKTAILQRQHNAMHFSFEQLSLLKERVVITFWNKIGHFDNTRNLIHDKLKNKYKAIETTSFALAKLSCNCMLTNNCPYNLNVLDKTNTLLYQAVSIQ